MKFNEKKKLETLKAIAETLNQSHDKKDMLQSVLKALIDISHFESGWIFLQNENMELMADEGLPPALSKDDKRPMCGEEDCYCISRFTRGRLTKATTIIECKRLKDAINEGKYETGGLTHHATVPLKTPEKMYGLLNVGASGRTAYIDEELDLLESIALQIGTALKRLEQVEKEEQRGRLLTALSDFVTNLRKERNVHQFGAHAGSDLIQLFDLHDLDMIIQKVRFRQGDQTCSHKVTFPFTKGGGRLTAGRRKPFQTIEKEVMQLAVQHIELAYRDLILQDKEKVMARIEERNRLAQDLHDSVSQLLYSIVLTAKAARQLNQDQKLAAPLQDLNELSSQALKEMRTLIAKKKASGLEEGLLTGLTRYAERLQLQAYTESEGSMTIPDHIEETLMRIGQEAIHNVKKHAQTSDVYIALQRTEKGFRLIIKDDGAGFHVNKYKDIHSFGLKGMKERAAVYNGQVCIESQPSRGTTVTVFMPDGGEKI